MGARYSDKGFTVMAADSADAAWALTDQDPSVKHDTFASEPYEFSMVYEGPTQLARRNKSTQLGSLSQRLGHRHQAGVTASSGRVDAERAFDQ
jgi:hypothetical protein